MDADKKKKLFIFFVFLIFLFSFISKIHNLGVASFDFDEIYSVKSTGSPYWKLITGIKYDPGNPPLYFIILKVWKSVVGESEFRLRLLSVVFHSIALIVLYFQAKKHLTKISTLIVMMLFASSGLIFFHSRYVRTYSLLILVSIAVFSLLLELIEKKKFLWPKVIIAYFLCLIGLYSHYSFVVYYIFLFLTFLFNCWQSKKKLKKLFNFTYFVFLGYSPWIVYFLTNQISPIRWWMKYEFGQVRQKWIGFEGWFAVFTNGLSRNLSSIKLQIIFFILFLLIFGYLLIKLYKKENNLWKKSVLFFFLVSFNALMFTPLHWVFKDPRYSIYILPFAFFAFGILIDSWKNQAIKYAIFVFLTPYSVLTYSSYIAPIPEDWRSLSNKIPLYEKNSVILFHPCYLGFSLDYYYKGSLPQYCFFENPEGMYLKIWDKKPQKTLYLISKPWRIENNQLLNLLTEEYSSSIGREKFGNIELLILKR